MADSDSGRRIPRHLEMLALTLALLGGAAMASYHLGFFIPRMLAVRSANGLGNGFSFGDDFYPLWLTTRQWRLEHRDLYGVATTKKIQTGLFGRPLDASIPTDPLTDYRQFT